MAIYNGREVQVQHFIDVNNDPIVQMSDREGNHMKAALSKIQFTEDEKKNLEVENGKRYETLNVIKDKDLKELRDSQDPKKNEERMKDQQAGQDVSIVAKNAQVATKPALQPNPKVNK